MRRKALFICGSINQTSQMHQISMRLPEYDCYFTPYYADGIVEVLRKLGLLDFTVLGYKLAERCLDYLHSNNLAIDVRGELHDYDLVLTCSDLIIPANVTHKKIVLVQEGMTDPENFLYHMVRKLRLPRYLASTSTTGLSHGYDYFCIASEGYRDLFERKGVSPAKLCVTGIPNFDNCEGYLKNDFPHRNYVMVATSDMRETFRMENRKKFIQECLRIADGRKVIFKLHPNEKFDRAIAEIREQAPNALIYTSGHTDHMIANCDVLITRYSSVVYVASALQKEIYSDFDAHTLKRMTPIQNSGTSAALIAEICRRNVDGLPVPSTYEDLYNITFAANRAVSV